MHGILSIPSNLFSILVDKGFIYLLSFVVSYLYLSIRQIIQKKRICQYDYHALGQPEKNGFLVPKEEYELEGHRKSVTLKKFSDDAYIFGSNSKSESLAIHVSRIPNKEVRCSVVLRLQDGRLFFLPKEHAVQRGSTEDFTFGSSRLKLQCLIPMRRWRVFFNGILEEYSNGVETTPRKYKHVKFTFLWAASTEIFDFSNGMSKTLLAHSAAGAASWTTTPMSLLQSLRSIFDRYEQGGMLQGTLQIENETEQEIYLWGNRGRSFAKLLDLKNSNYMDIIGSFKNGNVVHFGVFTIPGVIQRFVYGHVMRADAYVYPFDNFESEDLGENMIVKCCSGGRKYTFKIDTSGSNDVHFQKEYGGSTYAKMIKISTDKFEGHGVLFNGTITEDKRASNNTCSTRIRSDAEISSQSPLTVPFENPLCQASELCGGKGSSLGCLYSMAEMHRHRDLKFSVPNGIVVTTASYEEFTKNTLEKELQKFEKEIWSNSQKDITALCKQTVENVSKNPLPQKVKQSIEHDLKLIFGNSLSDRRFAVRSSATGEDTEQMSAAGQMETFLGLMDLDQIFSAVTKCWASQFTFQAIEYKRRYGQRLNTPMAVVIQEMVSCDVAGVIFTCDPVSGNPSYISITANWGLGESVVSATAEPDTVILARDTNNKLQLHSTIIGKKKSKTVMDGPLGTVEVPVDDHNAGICCLSESDAMKLGQISIDIEHEYGSSRDLEWGIAGGNIYMFQSRPVTSLDIETDFETEHHMDSALRAEIEIFARGHVGEVMPGALSTLGSEVMFKLLNAGNGRQYFRSDGADVCAQKPYYEIAFVIARCTVFFDMISGFFKFSDQDDSFTKPFLVSMFGRLIDDKEVREISCERHPDQTRTLKSYFLLPYTIFNAYFHHIYCWWITRQQQNFAIPYGKTSPADETLVQIAAHHDGIGETMNSHLINSIASSFWNSILLGLLAKSEGDWNNRVYSDFAYLLSTCTEVESADVPAAIQKLAYIISKSIDPEKFKSMSTEDALKWLETNSSEAAKQYKEFLQRHGHRCIKEFDMYSKVWRTAPLPLIKSLQEMVSKDSKPPTEKKIDSFPVILSKMKIKLGLFEKLKLFWALPNARRAVRYREFSKAFLVRLVNRLRRPFDHMAEQMVLEGRLPRKDHLFFLSLEEIRQLSKNRCPRLVAKAARRFKIFDKLDNYMFPEFNRGNPEPMNKEKIPVGKGYCMTGVPVSQGIVKGTARVCMNIREAPSIQQGDILITYCTDIAWSPYFPLLSGVVTELGGLISHGAVVAREYGLPCVVALHGATRAFTSGDIVVVDGNKGTLQKVEDGH